MVLRFDDLAAGTRVTNQYASKGIHFAGGSFGVQTGNANGDPGNWDLDGTNGPFFLGYNGDPSYLETVTFDGSVTAFSLDVSRSNGSAPGDSFVMRSFAGAVPLEVKTLSFPPINEWTTLSFTLGGITRVEWVSMGSAFRPYGVDNVQFEIPEPGALAVVGMGTLVCLMRRGKNA